MSVITQCQLLKSAIVVGTACLGLGSFSLSAMAITVFNFGDSTSGNFPTGATNYTVIKDNITASLSNYRFSNGDPISFDINSNTNGDGAGILLAQYDDVFGGQGLYAFDLALSTSSGNPVDIISIVIRTSNALNLTLDFTNGTNVKTASFFVPQNSSPPRTNYLQETPEIGDPFNSPLRVNSSSLSSVVGSDKLSSASTEPFSYLAEIHVQEVPWETDVLPLVGATFLFGGGVWWKRRRAAASQLDLTGQGLEQESGQE